MEYDLMLEVQTNKKLTDNEKDRLREAVLKALDEAKLPFNADVVTGSVLER